MTNYEVIQTMTVKELEKALSYIKIGYIPHFEKWLRADSQTKYGLLTDEMKKYWRVH